MASARARSSAVHQAALQLATYWHSTGCKHTKLAKLVLAQRGNRRIEIVSAHDAQQRALHRYMSTKHTITATSNNIYH
eukprot:4665-Heterococcus_DN1.PRE.1